MAEKNKAEDGSSISLKSPCHMKWDRQQNIPYFTCFLMSQKCKFCFLLYLKEIYAQFVETNVLVKHNIYHELKLTIMDLDWQITWKHPVCRRRMLRLRKVWLQSCGMFDGTWTWPVNMLLQRSGHWAPRASTLGSCLQLYHIMVIMHWTAIVNPTSPLTLIIKYIDEVLTLVVKQANWGPRMWHVYVWMVA